MLVLGPRGQPHGSCLVSSVSVWGFGLVLELVNLFETLAELF